MEPPHRQPAGKIQTARFLAAAEAKLTAARRVLALDPDAAFQLACEAILKASLALSRSRTRPLSTGPFPERGSPIQRRRRKRRPASHGPPGPAARPDAAQALATAAQVVAVARARLR